MTPPTARQLASVANAMDAELMLRLRGRDTDALRGLYDRHAGMVYGLGMRILGSSEGAEDLVQDVFLHLWQRAEAFDGDRGAFPGWLVSLTRNRAIERLRAAGPARADADPAGRPVAAPGAVDPNESAYVTALRGAVAKALAALPEAQRAALERAYFGGMSHAEIAQVLDAPPATVRARIRQGMMRMRDLLGEFASPGLVADTED